jgi:pimeloyl-ACP methyl ester carboxylesterase
MSKVTATEAVFLPGFDGDAGLRQEFIAALGERRLVRPVSYPNRPLGSIDEYHRYAASQIAPDARPVVIAESFSGLVAIRWAASDPRVVALVLCAGFARNPVGLAASLGATLPAFAKLGAHLFVPFALASGNDERRRWGLALATTVRNLREDVVTERFRLVVGTDVRTELAALRIPIVLVQLEHDLVIGPGARSELEALCHDAQVVPVQGPHFALEILPRQCAAAIQPQIEPFFRP